MTSSEKPKFRFSIDRGGTFTDIFCEIAQKDTTEPKVVKLLSEDPSNYDDAPREGIRRIINEYMGTNWSAAELDTSLIDWIRMGTTVATNALLERKGAKCALVTTRGFADLLRIGNQSRPAIFDLVIKKADMLFSEVVELNERVQLVGKDSAVPKGYDESIPVVNHESGQQLRILQTPKDEEIRSALQNLKSKGIRSIAVVFLHSYIHTEHEEKVGKIAQELGFENVSLSHKVMPMIRAVPRGNTTAVDAYLTPVLRQYVDSFCAGFKDNLEGVNVTFMQSDGGLTPAHSFMGSRAILSGPAGGVVGAAATAYDPETKEPVISIDIGGTSCDYSRCNGPDALEHVYETELAGVTIQAPQLDITTVAAGGGSRLFFKAGRFVVGPESAGSHPGPICYRKNGYLAVTDANLFLGRLIPEYFPKIFGESEKEPLDYDATKVAFEELTAEINDFRRQHYSGSANAKDMTPEEVALGFIKVANEAMCRPIRALTVSKGYDVRNHVLACFGGAGAQMACSIAKILKIKKVKIHRYSGILSAYGLGMADVVQEEQESCSRLYQRSDFSFFEKRINTLAEEARKGLRKQGFSDDNIKILPYLNLRYVGTDYAIMTDVEDGNIGSYREEFEKRYHRQYGFKIPDRDLTVDDIRVRGIGKTASFQKQTIAPQGDETPQPISHHKTFYEQGWMDTPVYDADKLGGGAQIEGPCVITQGTSTIVVIPGAVVNVTNSGDIEISLENILSEKKHETISTEVDPIQLAIFGHRFMSIAEQMGRTLQRTAISTNIKERLDFSCAIFGPDGHLISNAPHMPVHLGSMSEAVTYQIQHLKDDWKEGEVLISNHPHAGGSHLPDLNVISPCYDYIDAQKTIRKPVFYVASRGHHADIGGITPGSMPPFSKRISEEGVAITSFKLVKNESFQLEGISKIFNEAGARNLRDNIADMKAQVAANNQGISLLKSLIQEYGLKVVQAYMQHVQDNATLAVKKMLASVAEKRGHVLEACDYMDDGSAIRLKITIDDKNGAAVFDFTGTSEQVYGNTNAPRSITSSAVLYCLRCLVTMDIPLNHGCLANIKIILPDKSILKPDIDSAVVGGNVLTSQRVTDVIFKAFKAVSASQGCMNNFVFGSSTYGYYETICGGAGAGPSWDGASAVHTHMTNTRITDAEILEKRYPVLLHEFSIRRGSGGQGKHRGGDGVVREVEFLTDLEVSILSERRVFAPYGLFGGRAGQRGKNLLIMKDGSVHNLGGKNQVKVTAGDTIRIMTPGGGGFGRSGSEERNSTEESDIPTFEDDQVFDYENDREQAEAGRSAYQEQKPSVQTPTKEDNTEAEVTSPSSKKISQWRTDEVGAWIESVPSISKYAINFKRKNIDGRALLDMGQRDDFIHIGIRSLRDIKEIQKEIWELRKSHS